MRHIPHSTYYQDRQTEYQLCTDFPGDEILIDGLHAMQAHFYNRNIPIEIPVVRVMNTAHFVAAYMFSTECSGDQLEYDVLAYDSLSRDKQLAYVAMIVLAAMLKRTKGLRASNCRNLILDKRTPDFDDGVTLYDKFLKSAEKRFAEEDFLIDTHEQILKLKAENEQLIAENAELKIKYQTMENKYQQINIGTQNNNCTQIGSQYNITYVMPSQEEAKWSSAQPSSMPDVPQQDQFKYIHVLVTDEAERAEIHRMVSNIVRLPKMQLVCDELYKLMKNKKVLCSINPDAMLSELRRLGLPSADTVGFSDKNFYHYYKAPKLD